MKRALFLTVLSLLAASSFADIHHRNLFIEGTASRTDHYEFFMKNFTLEAEGAGYNVTRNKNESAFTFNFNANSNAIRNNYQYLVKISLFRNEDGFEVTTIDFFYNYIDEVYEYTRTLFQNATLYIPIYTTEELNAAQGRFDNWKNKWIYLRASFDYPISFYLLNDSELKGGAGLFNSENDAVSPIDHKIIAMPGATVGLEFQFLNFMSIELDFMVSMGDTRNNLFINMAAGLELKFPIKFDNIALVPYGVFVYPLNVSTDVFDEFPLFAFGAGIQLCARAGRYGAFFIDVNYTFSLSQAVMHNPYLAFPKDKQLFPEPAVIHHDRSIIGIGVGYKFGLFDR